MRRALRQAQFYQKNPTGIVRGDDVGRRRPWRSSVGHGLEPDFPKHEVGQTYRFHVSRWKGKETKS